jgi:hypothetical protein
MALFIEPPVDRRSDGAARVRLDLGGCPQMIGDEGTKRIGIIGRISNDMVNALEPGQERLGLRAIAILPRRWIDTQRQADRIDHGMQFGRQPTA